MQQPLRELEHLHEALLDALDAGDVERVHGLVRRRENLLQDLQAAYDAATAAERDAAQGDLQALARLDRDLQGRAVTLRDRLRGELDQQRRAGGGRSAAPSLTGVLDRQA